MIYKFLKCFYYYLICYACAFYYVILQCVENQRKPSKLVKRKEEFVVLITGGARGIGLETSLQLLKEGAIIIVAGIYKDQEEGLKTLKNSGDPDKIKFLDCDLSSLSSVRNVADNFNKLNLPLHIVINNAGIMFTPYFETVDGHEGHWSVNYLGHFLLSHLLLPNLTKSNQSSCPSRIVNLASCLHYPGTINFNDINGKHCYSSYAAYCQSKLAMVLFTKSLNQNLKSENNPVLVNSVHPAVAFSQLYTHIWLPSWGPDLARKVLHTPLDGSYTVVHAALSADVTKGGQYFENCQSVDPSREAQSYSVQGKLWQLSCDQLGITQFGHPD